MEVSQPIKLRYTFAALLPVSVLYFLTLDAPFFWDSTHLVSKQANWFFVNGLDKIMIPDAFDSGHPPFTGWFVAVVWMIFGKGLIQSHLFILPFLIVLVHQWILIVRYYLPQYAHFIYFLIFLNPYFLGQSMLVSPDIILIAAFGLTFHGILVLKKWKIILGSVILGLVSMRGMTCLAALAIFTFRDQYIHNKNWIEIWKRFLLFVPAGVLAAGFLVYHWNVKGWMGFHPGSPWAISFEPIDIYGFCRNILIMIWRFCDQGLLFIWFLPVWLLIFTRAKIRLSKQASELGILGMIMAVLVIFPQLWYKQLLMHRYFIPVIFIFILFTSCVIIENISSIKKYFIIVTVLMVSGYFWIYPDPISKGWDAMPMHIDFYKKNMEMLGKIEKRGMKKNEIGAAFPYGMPSSVLYLNDDTTDFQTYDLKSNRYILYSNISNDFSKDEIQELENHWKMIDSVGTWPVTFKLYEKQPY